MDFVERDSVVHSTIKEESKDKILAACHSRYAYVQVIWAKTKTYDLARTVLVL
jgi:hypothetical protein